MRDARLVWLPLLGIMACGHAHPSVDLGSAPSGVAIDARLQYYDVSAASLYELRRAMAQLGPRWEGRSYQAATQSRFRWTYVAQQTTANLCEPARVRVTVQTLVTFPRWNPSAEPDSSLLQWWRELNAGLMEHERGHALLSVKTAGLIARTIEDLPPVPCDQLTHRVGVAGQRLIDGERRQQVEYDRETRHGATQIEKVRGLWSP